MGLARQPTAFPRHALYHTWPPRQESNLDNRLRRPVPAFRQDEEKRHPWKESNLHPWFRRPVLYPLSYRGVVPGTGLAPVSLA